MQRLTRAYVGALVLAGCGAAAASRDSIPVRRDPLAWPTVTCPQRSAALPIDHRPATREENALLNDALSHHATAQSLRRRAVDLAEEDAVLSEKVEHAGRLDYLMAAALYQAYLQLYPAREDAYELSYSRADAFYFGAHYSDAARAYAEVRDSAQGETHRAHAARRVVESEMRLLDAAIADGSVLIDRDLPEASGTPPRVGPRALPAALQRVVDAREMYLACIDVAHDVERVRDAYALRDGGVFAAYGHLSSARARLSQIVESNCSGPQAGDDGRVAWLMLLSIADATHDSSEEENLRRLVADGECTFAPPPRNTPAAPTVDRLDD
jgi:hypothetical protein